MAEIPPKVCRRVWKALKKAHDAYYRRKTSWIGDPPKYGMGLSCEHARALQILYPLAGSTSHDNLDIDFWTNMVSWVLSPSAKQEVGAMLIGLGYEPVMDKTTGSVDWRWTKKPTGIYQRGMW